jgi:tetratricopeptide (TPR) repeat protein
MPRLIAPPVPWRPDDLYALESANEDVAVALWHSVHKVLLWAQTPVERRAALFRPVSARVRERIAVAADAVPLLADPLAVFLALQREPGNAAPASVGRACYLAWEWADRCGLHATARLFSEASAYADPASPTFAVIAGYMTRTAGGHIMLARSDAWHRRARVLAIQQKNREEVLRAQTGLGALMKDLGEYDEARAYYKAAVRRARRTGRTRRAAVAQHYLFALSADVGDVGRAVADARHALALYPLHDKRLPALAHDFAFLLIGQHCHRAALRLVDQLAGSVEGIFATGMLLGITARAAAGAGRPRRYRTAERAALNVAKINDECAGPILINLAEAARFAGRWDRVLVYARSALEIAHARADIQVERLALALLTTAERRDPPPLSIDPAPAPVAALARRIAARLNRWGRRKRGAGVLQ